MLYYIVDGSFDGILTAIYEAYYRKEIPEQIISEKDVQENFLIDKVYIETDLVKAEKVYFSIESKISNQALRNVFYVYLSEVKDRGTIIYKYLKAGWKLGRIVDSNLMDPHVLAVQNLCQRISKEKHFMLGLIRFRKLENQVYYAPVEPEYNVLGLIAPHFASRMANENWMLHDRKRNLAAAYNKKEWVIKELEINGDMKLDHEEENYQALWKEYFNSIAIKDKINPKLQKRNMPMKYWKYLIEK